MILALDLAAHDAAAIVADNLGVQRATTRLAIGRDALNREGTRAAWHVLIDAAREVLAQSGTGAADILAVALAFPARLREGVVQRGHDTDGWNGFAPAHALAQTFGFETAKVAARERVVCAALGEQSYGRLREVPSFLYLQMDEVFDAAFVAETSARALNLGAVCLDRDGIVGPSGRRGELEAYIGGANFQARAASYGITHRSAAEIWALASDNAAAASLCEDSARRLAQGIAIAQSLFACDTVCLGGAIAENATRLPPLLERACGEFCASPPRLVRAKLGHDASIFGALAVAKQNSTVEFDRTS